SRERNKYFWVKSTKVQLILICLLCFVYSSHNPNQEFFFLFFKKQNQCSTNLRI
ncbi:unnamed protein product, partial [Tenebrio molitor]